MSRFAGTLFALSLAMATTILATDVEAARLGGGRSVGTQRSATPPATAPSQAQPAAAPAQPAAAPASNRWLPLLGGLALGGLLGSMFSGGMGSVLLVLALVAGAVLLFGFIARQRAGAATQTRFAAAGLGRGYPDLGTETVAAPPPSQAAGFEAPRTERSAHVPADFDTASFLRNAKLNFIRLQMANDREDLDQIREVTTAEMYAVLAGDIEARRTGKLAPQQTDVVTLNADLLEVATGTERHTASVRFSGMMQEVAGTAPVGFEEIWNLVKPADGSTGWLLDGIQQMH